MAVHGLFSTNSLGSPCLYPSILSSLKPPATKNSTKSISSDQETKQRRSANYPPSSWDYNFVKSLAGDYNHEKYGSEVNELKEYVRNLISGDTHGSLEKLELIDSVQRLGLNYHFEAEIKKAIEVINLTTDDSWFSSDLYNTALLFRLFRQHGYTVPQDVFKRFKDATGEFRSGLCNDVKGLLSLYEASFFDFRGEDILDEAKTFTATNLRKSLNGETSDSNMQRKVKHALDMPLHRTLPRLETEWFIHTYEQEQNMDPKLLRLAKLDYNKVQSIYQKEISELARWWTELGLNKMDFFRDRLLEHYLWGHGLVWEPQYGPYRVMTAKVIAMVTIFDDLYDIYGSIEELELVTDFVCRWDITEIDKLPYNIRISVLAMFNLTNEIGYWTITERGFNIIPFLRKQWAYMCLSYMREAKMVHQGYKPTLDEYLDLAMITVGGIIICFCSYFLTADKITVEALDFIDQFPGITKCPLVIGRLHNDLVTSPDESARGDSMKAVQCYKNDTGATDEETKEYLTSLANEYWKILNEEMHKPYPFLSEPFLTSNLGMARTGYFFYRNIDGHGYGHGTTTKDHLNLLLVQPFPLD